MAWPKFEFSRIEFGLPVLFSTMLETVNSTKSTKSESVCSHLVMFHGCPQARVVARSFKVEKSFTNTLTQHYFERLVTSMFGYFHSTNKFEFHTFQNVQDWTWKLTHQKECRLVFRSTDYDARIFDFRESCAIEQSNIEVSNVSAEWVILNTNFEEICSDL